jgi:hypothetical protein
MSTFKIVTGKCEFDPRRKRYMMYIHSDGTITYHKFRTKVHTWSTKYGPYNTIKQKGGSATFYNVGAERILTDIQDLNIDIDVKTVAIGYSF